MQLELLDTSALRSRRPVARPGRIARSLRNVAACAIGFSALTGLVFGHGVGLHDPQLYGAAAGVAFGVTLWATRRL